MAYTSSFRHTLSRRTMMNGSRPTGGGLELQDYEQILQVPIQGKKANELIKSAFNKEKYLPLCYLPFKISHMCCQIMKKRPLHSYQKQSGTKPILGTMAEESRIRRNGWLKTGCNAFEGKDIKSIPMAFWTEQDVLAYIVKYGLKIASVYGDIVVTDKKGNTYSTSEHPLDKSKGDKYRCEKLDRTGCVFCGFGLHNEKLGEPTRFQNLKETHPKQYEYCIRGGQYIDNPDYVPNAPEFDGIWKNWNPPKIWVPSKEGLGFGHVFDLCNEVYGEEFFRYK